MTSYRSRIAGTPRDPVTTLGFGAWVVARERIGDERRISLALKANVWFLLQRGRMRYVFSLQHKLPNPLTPHGLSLTLP